MCEKYIFERNFHAKNEELLNILIINTAKFQYTENSDLLKAIACNIVIQNLQGVNFFALHLLRRITIPSIIFIIIISTRMQSVYVTLRSDCRSSLIIQVSSKNTASWNIPLIQLKTCIFCVPLLHHKCKRIQMCRVISIRLFSFECE